MDQTQIGLIQSKHPTCCTIALGPAQLFFKERVRRVSAVDKALSLRVASIFQYPGHYFWSSVALSGVSPEHRTKKRISPENASYGPIS